MVTIQYSDEHIQSLDEETLFVACFDEGLDMWVDVSGTTAVLDTTLNTITFGTTHFSLFALVGEHAALPVSSRAGLVILCLVMCAIGTLFFKRRVKEHR